MFLYFSKFDTVRNVNAKKHWLMPTSTFASKALIMKVDKSIMALISCLKRESSVFLWLFRGKTQPWDGFSSLKTLFNVSSTFLYLFNFKFRLFPLSENICPKFLSPRSWRIYEIVQKYNFHLRGLFATHGIGGDRGRLYKRGILHGIPLKAEDNICCGGRGGVFVKKRGLLDRFHGSWISRQL